MSDPGHSRFCPRCGQPIPPDERDCPRCVITPLTVRFSREGVLLSSLVLLGVIFIVTGAVNRLYHARESALAGHWFARGEADLREGRPTNALAEFRTALAYSPDNDEYQLRLAEALAAAERTDEARAYLMNLLQHVPGSGPANLELARLDAHSGSVSDAIRNYHRAIYGQWDDHFVDHQQQARLELCNFLLDHNAIQEARAEIATLAANLPPKDASSQVEAGFLFLRAQDPGNALEEFRQVLSNDRRNAGALSGAGQAAFFLGEYAQAERYLDRAIRENPKDKQAEVMLAQARQVLASDPLNVMLHERERAQRVAQILDLALARLQSCAVHKGLAAPGSAPSGIFADPIARTQAMRRDASLRNLRSNPDLLQQAMDLVFDDEQLAARECGQPQGADAAILLLAQKYRSAKR
jgi:tetratricopeptide (TPR) repeat protein